ncbi:MIP/aquaporin family protein [Bradyrhizobium tropiciagri]|uniref:MIP/aquaporin family protein n=1 Tax=Bradyrhizobium tropiciagri TaxID=312253 RepID=UPI00067D0B37|nr:aquaporin [Bradyrhizobium tropiciagri]
MPERIASKLLAELVGTFSFVFIGAGAAAVVGSGLGLSGIVAVALAHGLTIMCFAFAYGSVSGGHMNPAVTIGVLAARAIRTGEAIGYVVSQLIGGIAGAFTLQAVLGGSATGLGTPALAHNLALGATTLTITPAAGFMIEAVQAFFLVTIVLSTAVAGRAGNLAPLAIGMTLTLNILMGGALTGAPSPSTCPGPDGRDRQFRRRLAVPDGADRRRHCRGHSAYRTRPSRPRRDCSRATNGKAGIRRIIYIMFFPPLGQAKRRTERSATMQRRPTVHDEILSAHGPGVLPRTGHQQQGRTWFLNSRRTSCAGQRKAAARPTLADCDEAP